MYGFRPKSLTVGVGLPPRLYAGPVCDESAAEVAFVALSK